MNSLFTGRAVLGAGFGGAGVLSKNPNPERRTENLEPEIF
jgi:hypothetical protein